MSKYYVREDDAKRDGVIGPLILTHRANTAAAQSTHDGDYSPLITDTNGKLWVNASGIALGEPADGTYIGDVKFGEAVELAAGSAAIGSVTIGAGSAAIGKLAENTDGVYIGDIKFGEGLPANSGVDIGDVDVTSVVPGTGATNLGKAEDAAHTSGDVGVMPLGVRDDVAASLADTDGDYSSLSLDKYGRLRVANPDAVDVWRFFNTDTSSLGDTNLKAGVSNNVACITDLKVSFLATTLTSKLVIEIDDGTTLMYSQTLTCPTNNLVANLDIHFDTPLFASSGADLTIKATYTLAGSGSASHAITASGYSIPA